MSLENILALDARLSSGMRVAEQPGALRSAAAVLAHSGDSWFWLAGLALVWVFGARSWKGLAAVMVIGILLLAICVLIIKFAVRRRRPEGEWGKVYRFTDPHSFPSGHAARAALLALIAIGAGPVWLGILLIVWAPLVSLARVAMGVHYLSDVVAGSVMGIVVGAAVLHFYL